MGIRDALSRGCVILATSSCRYMLRNLEIVLGLNSNSYRLDLGLLWQYRPLEN